LFRKDPQKKKEIKINLKQKTCNTTQPFPNKTNATTERMIPENFRIVNFS
jgi:hypothetical protein